MVLFLQLPLSSCVVRNACTLGGRWFPEVLSIGLHNSEYVLSLDLHSTERVVCEIPVSIPLTYQLK